jgi:hypothetical protein
MDTPQRKKRGEKRAFHRVIVTNIQLRGYCINRRFYTVAVSAFA